MKNLVNLIKYFREKPCVIYVVYKKDGKVYNVKVQNTTLTITNPVPDYDYWEKILVNHEAYVYNEDYMGGTFSVIVKGRENYIPKEDNSVNISSSGTTATH